MKGYERTDCAMTVEQREPMMVWVMGEWNRLCDLGEVEENRGSRIVQTLVDNCCARYQRFTREQCESAVFAALFWAIGVYPEPRQFMSGAIMWYLFGQCVCGEPSDSQSSVSPTGT